MDLDGKVITKPVFNRKIVALTHAKRVWTRDGGVQRNILEGITLRKHLREKGQSTL